MILIFLFSLKLLLSLLAMRGDGHLQRSDDLVSVQSTISATLLPNTAGNDLVAWNPSISEVFSVKTSCEVIRSKGSKVD